MTSYLPQPNSHDLNLPSWGPYTKKYNGLSHIADAQQGLRFDLSVFPAYYKNRVTVPHVQWESGYHPWEAASDLSYYSYRYDLEWKDQVYCDVAFFSPPGQGASNLRWIRCELSNQTAETQHLALHLMACLNFPPVRPYSDEAVLPAEAHLPAGATWIDALDYTDLQFAVPRPSDNLVYEGWWRGEVRAHGFVHGTGIGQNFGLDCGDRLDYLLPVARPLQNAVLLLRCRLPGGALEVEISGLQNCTLTLPASPQFTLVPLVVGPLNPGQYPLTLRSRGGAPLELDGWVLLEERDAPQVHFTQHTWNPVPEITSGPGANTLLLRYSDLNQVYGLAWSEEHPSEVRQFFSAELDRTLRYYGIEHVAKVMQGEGEGHFTNVFIRPILLEPHSTRVVTALVCSGDAASVQQWLSAPHLNPREVEAAFQQARQKRVHFESNSQGLAYRFSQERLAATLMSNVVYPVYTRRSFIRHFTPGKRWDCLYTWDSGFIALGLLEVSLERAIDCLNAYTTPPGDGQAAFIHHGSPVPVQIYAFQELWNRTGSRPLLEYFYPRLRQFYLFLAGRLGSSTTRVLPSNLLKTWDYFYNSGGWDDLPPQVAVHALGLEARVTPVITTTHLTRCAKILQQAASTLGLQTDVDDYQADIDTWSAALQRYAWDAGCGYFSYVVHDEEGRPMGFLRHTDGSNLNRGLDGISPLFAGICTPAQETQILEHIFSPEHLWTPSGITSVDQAAAYFKAEGYWNGGIWFPYQWFIWKALLDLGRGDLAYQIAHTALEIWQAEVARTYNCYEMWVAASGRGSGWHQFGGLSSPVLSFFGAYHHPGRLTCGFDTHIETTNVSADGRHLNARLQNFSTAGKPYLLLAVMPASANYSVWWNGSPAPFTEREPGVLEISVTGSGLLDITA